MNISEIWPTFSSCNSIISHRFIILGGLVIEQSAHNNTIARQTEGTAETARTSVRQYFNDLRDTIQQQESEALSVINAYVREKLRSLRQQQEDMAVLISQVSNVCGQCDRALKRSDAEVSIK